MPILHQQLAADTLTSAGTVIHMPPPAVLRARGPVVQVTLTVATAIAQQILQQGGQIPAPVAGLALIDTGASITCVDDAAAQQIGAPVVDVVNMASASHAGHKASVYPVRFEVVGLPIALNANRAVGAALQPQGLLMLIGRDLLQHCTLHYNGTSGELTLAL